MYKVNNKKNRMTSMTTVDFEQVNVIWIYFHRELEITVTL